MSARSVVPLACLSLLAACGSPPPAAPTAPPKEPVAKEPAVDVSPVAEPAGLVALARVAKPDAIVKTVSGWVKLPLPTGAELLRSITDDAVAEVVDLSRPLDAAMTSAGGRFGFEPVYAYAVAVKDFDTAKAALGKSHRLVPGSNGQIKVLDMGRRGPAGKGEEDDDGDDGTSCVLAHAPSGARLVCGAGGAAEALAPYLSRTMPNLKWSSDIHIELRPEPMRAPLLQLRATLPMLARSMLGGNGSPAVRDFVDACVGELVDVVGDAQKLQLDVQVADAGITTTSRLDLQSTKSVLARMATHPEKATEPPPAFWHLPGDADVAFYANGSDPKLFDHPRELLAGLLVEAATSTSMPEAERKAVRELVGERMLALFGGTAGVYGKGFDPAGVDKAIAARAKVKPNDVAGDAEAKRLLVEQVVGWHLYQVQDPLAKVGPILKDWSALWNRPAFSKWASATHTMAGGGGLPKMQMAALPAGVALPKDTVHLEVTIPRDDIEDAPSAVQTTKKPAKPKMIHRKPALFHVFAVPDGNATWLAFGMDPKLVASKAVAALASSPDTSSLGKAPRRELLHDGKYNGAGFLTLKGLAVFAAVDGGSGSFYSLLGSLPTKGDAPIFVTAKAEGPSANAAAGSTVAVSTIGRAVIEDIVKLALAAR